MMSLSLAGFSLTNCHSRRNCFDGTTGACCRFLMPSMDRLGRTVFLTVVQQGLVGSHEQAGGDIEKSFVGGSKVRRTAARYSSRRS